MYLSTIGLASTAFGVISYFKKVKKNNSPKHPILLFSTLIIAVILGAVDIYQQYTSGSSFNFSITIIFTLIPVFLLTVFTFLLLQKKPALGNINIVVGDPILPFQATTSEGHLFKSSAFKGKRTLLKFYRGSWCPYCSAELKMFEQMKGELEQHGVQVVGLCNESSEAIRAHIKRDALSHTLLSDPTLNVIRQYGVEHHKALSNSSPTLINVLGLELPIALSYQTMPIPTSILIDEMGVVKWIDQLDDYRLRANRERVMAAVNKTFPL